MQLPLPFRRGPRASTCVLVLGRRTYHVDYVRVRRARHYILRLDEGARVRVTIPWGGSRAGAERFVRERRAWLERERYRQALRRAPGPWDAGTELLLRGDTVTLAIVAHNGGFAVQAGPERIEQDGPPPRDLRPLVERHLRRLAETELPVRLAELAAAHGYCPTGVGVRSQRSRWGSCSRAGRISLNWRLVQMPPPVRDYVLLHELVHLVHLDHSPRFWREVGRVCPWHAEARRWIRDVLSKEL